MPPPALPTPPATIDDFKARFGRRDFAFGRGTGKVTDKDIQDAMTDAMGVFNARLFSIPDGWNAFLYLTAHFVRTNIQAAGGLNPENESGGVENQAEQVMSSAGAAGVSQSFVEPPERVKRSAILLPLWNTTYGQKYCAMALGQITGAVSTIEGPVDLGTLNIPPVPYAEQ